MPSPRKHGGGTKRDAILTAAAELVLARGYENTSMDAVAARAGVSKTTVYAHFMDKLELFKAVMANSAAELVEHLETALQKAGGEEPAERLTTALLEILKAGTAPQMLAFYRVLITETERRPQLTAGMEDVMADSPDVVDVIAGLIRAHAEQQGFEVVRPDSFAGLMLRLVTSGVQLDMLLTDFEPAPGLLESHVRCVVNMMLRGIQPEKPNGKAALPAGYDYPWGPALNRAVLG